jgi:hypothetical protein
VRSVFSRTVAGNLSLFLLSILFRLAVAEGAARLLPEDLFAYNRDYAGDPLLGMPLRYVDVSTDFPEQPKPVDVYRIVVLGDSHTVSVSNQASYAKVLQKLLNEEGLKGKRVEIYNAGANGHSHYQYYLTLKERLISFQPDLVIVGFYIGNDFLDLYRNDDRPRLLWDGKRFVHNDPQFIMYSDPHATDWVQAFKVGQLIRLLFQRTVGYQIAKLRALWNVGQDSGEGVAAVVHYLYTTTRGYFIHKDILTQSMLQVLFLKSFPKERAAIDRVNARITELMKALADREHIELLYVPIPTELQVVPDQNPVTLNRTLQLFGYDRSVLGLEDHLNASFVSLLNEHHIESIDVKVALKAAPTTDVLYDNAYHLTERAHAVIGRELYKRVSPIVMAWANSSSADKLSLATNRPWDSR